MLRIAATVLAVPPANLAILLLVAIMAAFWAPARRLALRAGLLCAVLLVLFSLPIISMALLASLEPGPSPAPLHSPRAIVILGGDVEKVNEAPGVVIGPLSLERVRAGAILARSTGLPVLVTGGIVSKTDIPVSSLMQDTLVEDFAVAVKWTEPTSFDTWENAQRTAEMLHSGEPSSVFLVTHAWHMRRSLYAFRRAGIEAVPVPVRHDRWPVFAGSEFIPRSSSWNNSYLAFHEWLGLAWYALRG